MISMQFLRRDRWRQCPLYFLMLLLTSALLLMTSFFFLMQLVDTHRVQAATIDYPYPGATNDAELVVQLTADVTTATIGSYIHYTMTVANLTTVTTTKTFAFTELPTQTTFITGNVTVQAIAQISETLQAGNYYDPQYHSIAWVGTLAPQSSSTLFFTVKVKETAACDDLLQAKSLWLAEALTIPMISCVNEPLPGNPDLSLTYTSNVTSTTLGGVIQYEVLIRNRGSGTTTNLTLLTLLPSSDVTRYLTNTLIASSGNISFSAASNSIYWAGSVPALGSVRITYALQVIKAMPCNALESHILLEGSALPIGLYASTTVRNRCPEIRPLQLELRASTTETIPGGMIAYQLLVTNTSDLPTDEFHILNIIPLGAAYITGSATATVGTFTNMPSPKELTWTGAIPEHTTGLLSFQIKVRERIPCGKVMKLLAIVYDIDYMQPSDAGRESTIIATCITTQPWSDFGNAPDSDSNHHGMNNTAYPETGGLGHFPTVWEGTPANEASGPTHYTGDFWLGAWVDAEVEADLNLDEEFGPYDFTNILHNGQEDTTGWDTNDGWLNPSVPMLHCETTTLLVNINRDSLPKTVERLWLNVWIDGNRDGDWQDSGRCPSVANPEGVSSFEWIVQDYPIEPNEIPTDEPLTLQIPTELVYNSAPTLTTWVRFTLSEQPAVRPTPVDLADGRGLAYPDLFQVGETEDYRIDGLPQGEPITMALQHFIGDPITGTVFLGEKIPVDILLKPAAGVMPATVTMEHLVAAEVAIVAQPEFYVFQTPENELLNKVDGINPLALTFHSNEGPSGQLEWRGQLRRDVGIYIKYEAKVKVCPPPNENGQPMLRSVAQVRQPDGTLFNVEATYLVDCTFNVEEPEQLFLPLVNK